MQFASFSWIPNSRPSSSVCCAPTPSLYLETVASRLASYTNGATNAAWPQHLSTPACPLTFGSLLATLFPGVGSDSGLINMTCPNCTTSCSCGDNCGCGSNCQCRACPGGTKARAAEAATTTEHKAVTTSQPDFSPENPPGARPY